MVLVYTLFVNLVDNVVSTFLFYPSLVATLVAGWHNYFSGLLGRDFR